MAGERLAGLMIDAGRNSIPASERTDVIYGKVVSTSPLTVQVVNEPKMVLPSEFLILSPLCEKRELTIPIKSTEIASNHSHQISAQTVTLWRGLQVDDIVLMLRVHGGNKFYILQREGDL